MCYTQWLTHLQTPEWRHTSLLPTEFYSPTPEAFIERVSTKMVHKHKRSPMYSCAFPSTVNGEVVTHTLGMMAKSQSSLWEHNDTRAFDDVRWIDIVLALYVGVCALTSLVAVGAYKVDTCYCRLQLSLSTLKWSPDIVKVMLVLPDFRNKVYKDGHSLLYKPEDIYNKTGWKIAVIRGTSGNT